MYLIIWEYEVKMGSEEAFENMYGPSGDWAQLFNSDTEYSKTILLKDSPEKQIYLTLDFWNSELDYEDFYAKNESEISRLDGIGDQLTLSERLIGRFEMID